VQKALTGRKLVLQELYKYYSWSPEAEGASRHQKLTMSAENFVKLATDAKLLSNQVWAARREPGRREGHAARGGGDLCEGLELVDTEQVWSGLVQSAAVLRAA
jgi:hypothetical protein